MEHLKVIDFLDKNENNLFPNKSYNYEQLETLLTNLPDEFEAILNQIPFKKPETVQLISIFPLGIERFYLGQYVTGLLKWITTGGWGIWWIIDLINAKKRCREHNCKKLCEAINNPHLIYSMAKRENSIQNAVKVGKNIINSQELKDNLKDLKKSVNDLNNTFHN